MAREDAVYRLNFPDGTCRMVASSAKRKAATLLGVKIHQFNALCIEEDDSFLMELALSDPGSVWTHKPGGQKWVKTSDSRRAQSLPSHGGRRPGAGQPRIASEPGKNRGVRMDDETYEKFKAYGGMKYMRAVLAADLELQPEEWQQIRALGGVDWLRAQLAVQMNKGA